MAAFLLNKSRKWKKAYFFKRLILAAGVLWLLLPAIPPIKAQPVRPDRLYNLPARPQYNRVSINQTAINLEQGRHLGEIKEQSPLLSPPQRQNFAPITPMIPPLQIVPAKPQPAPAPAVIIGTYPLTETLLSRLEKIHAEILKLPELDENNTDDDISGGVDILVTAMERRPDIMGILGRNLISARDYIFAMQAVSAALNAASGAEEAQIFGENNKVSAENLAFGKKYADRIRRLLEE
ncbi:hypothetical protein [Candidatus Tokpelaia sp.]|uniref:hypothetical protein n=1 Tax=Candidatus Tokpelaia sp. TaxID=2233777 RepID=UPI00123C15FC|nr:hypothetical protein [Candidatus Tokpelaia sp.]KAA6406082.1 hypothetical protein DPQ22_01195 [Candidatus Tokpelaia sp.]